MQLVDSLASVDGYMLYFSRWKIISILWSLLRLALPTPRRTCFPSKVLMRLPDWLPKDQMTLGLDLQGGSHLLMQVDRDAMVDERKETLEDDARRILRAEKIGYRFSKPQGINGVDIRLRDDGATRAGQEKA